MKDYRLAYLLSPLLVAAMLRAGESTNFSPDALAFFEKNIRPHLVENCYSCHGAEKQKGGLRLDSRNALLKGGNGGPAIVIGKADTSILMQAIRHEGDLAMPPKKKLPDTVLQNFAMWIQSGAAWSADRTVVQDENAWQKHWSFVPVRDAVPPKTSNPAWSLSPIDAFVLAKLDASKIAPSPRADKRTLIRRATYDLTGLPPTYEEVQAFENDTTPDAFKNLVERLLASPRYGERWGRYWLDVARYADTKGYVYDDRESRQFVHSYVYRDWVIDAFNKDMPYDEFLLKQIAAEHYAKDKPDALAAAGFLTLGRRFLGNVHDIIDDRIDTLTRGTLGLSVSCSRCHDHKFDPVSTQDYYSLYGIFLNSLERTQALHPLQKNAQYAAYEKGLQERVAKLEAEFIKRKEQAMGNYRSRVDEYLIALLDVSKLPSEEFYEILSANDVNPIVVRQWQTYVFKTSREHAVLAPWHAYAELTPKNFAKQSPAVAQKLAAAKLNPRVAAAFAGGPPASMRDVAERYGKLLKTAYDEWQTATKKASDEKRKGPTKLDDAAAEELRQVLFAATEIPAGNPASVEFYLVEESARVELGKLQVEIDNWIVGNAGAPPHAVFLEDSATPKTSRVFVRGNPRTRGEEVPPHFLKFLGNDVFKCGSGRLELAQAIANRKNPLTARVMANRVWAWHFGNGLAATPSDFGMRSEIPSHPELLDYLSSRLMDRWSIKDLHRLIMLSNVYQQSSANRAEVETIDPGNRLLWRINGQRLDFESMRDSLLAVSGKLDLKMFGRSVKLMKQPFSSRRTVYGLIDRTNLPGVMRVFDFPNPDMHSPQRFNTTVPQQALFFMNNAFIIEQAQALIARPEIAALEETDARIHRIHEILYQRRASSKHLSSARAFIAEVTSEVTKPTEPVNPTEQSAVPPPDSILVEFWEHIEGNAVANLTDAPDYLDSPTEATYLKSLEFGPDRSDSYGSRVRGWIKAPEDGEYTFWIASDDNSELWLGTSEDPKSKQKIASVAEWTNHREYEKFPTQKSAKIKLEKDKKYYIEALHKEASGGDNLSVQWQLPSGAKEGPIPGNRLTACHAPVIKKVEPKPFGAWERYVQVLLLSNEFLFVD